MSTNMKENRPRLSYIDWAKAIGIALICIGHFLPRGNAYKVVFYAFHVPLFAFISGLLSQNASTFKECAKKLLRLCTRIFVPYVIWHFISGIISVRQGFREWNYVFKSFFFLDGMTVWNDALWYAPSIFIVCAIFTLICYLVKGNKYAILGLALASLGTFITLVRLKINITAFGYNNFLGTRNMIMLLGFVCLGYVCKDLVKIIVEFKENRYKNYLLYGSVGLLALLIYIVDKLNHKNPITLLYGDYNNIYHFVFFAILISFTLVIACALLPDSKIVSAMSRHSLFIMCSHYIFLLKLVRNTGVASSASATMILWSIAINVVLFYAIVCPLVDYICKKLPVCKRILFPFGFGY